MDWVKRNTFKWFGHMERKNCGEFVKKVYINERRVRPVVRWKDRVKEYMHERDADRGGAIGIECVSLVMKSRLR